MSGARGGPQLQCYLVLMCVVSVFTSCHFCVPSCASTTCIQCAVTVCGLPGPQYPRTSVTIRNCMYKNCEPGPRYSGHFLTWKGLKYGCGCNAVGSLQTTCDIVTGQCSCRPNVVGRTCSSCKEGYWGLSARNECFRCNCDHIGSVNNVCDPHSGQCSCKPGVGGRACDKCLPRFYGFSHQGCAACEPCNKPGHVCDPDTGRCICPPFTRGASCNQCVGAAWGFQPEKGCKPCNCELTGAIHQQCDAVTGRCFCREGYAGDHCTSCTRHYHGFPHCRRCDCHIAGTRDDQCDPRAGQCNCDLTGQCPCKAHVTGKKCQLCKEGTFGLQAENPDGCTQCFCFGRTTACTQAGLTWSQIMIPRPRTLTIEYDSPSPDGHLYPVSSQEVCFVHLAFPGNRELSLNGTASLNITNGLYVIPGDAGDVRMGVSYLFSTPIYWQLPQQFLGDKVLSYGGTLRFTVKTEGNPTRLPSHVLSTYPLIQLQGNNMVLEHYPSHPPVSGHYGVRLHESLWKLKNERAHQVTREVLMVALQNVQHILIRAADSVDFTRVVLSDVTLDTAVAVPGQPHPLARGVELCSCPAQYNSTSCQDPSIGFYRWHSNNSISSTIVIQLVGEARPCECNGRSKVCDIETGHCLSCLENTGGPHCERCAEGYYGDPSVAPCRPCPCPSVGHNFAVSCQVVRGKVIACHCRTGYTGQRCDRCAYGWFGLPRLEGGSCTPCRCNVYGSVSDECHEETGQCNCRVGIIGRDCSQCQDRHVLSPHGCLSCNDSCTGLLLNELEDLTSRLDRNTSHIAGGLIPPPWEPLMAINATSKELRTRLEEWLQNVERVSQFPTNLAEELRRKAKLLHSKSSKLAGSSKDVPVDASAVQADSRALLDKILSLQENIEGVIHELTMYGRDDSGAVSVEAALKEAQQLLQYIQRAKGPLQASKDLAVGTLRKCEQQLMDIKKILLGNTGLNPLRQGIDKLTDRLDDLLGLLRNASTLHTKARDLTTTNTERLTKPKNTVEEILRMKNEVDTLSDESQLLVSNASVLLDEARVSNKMFQADDNELASLMQAVREKEGILYRLNPLYEEQYVAKAQAHADKLFRWAQHYRDLFNATRQDADFALRASQAYQGIVDALQDARKSAVNARDAAEIAFNTALSDSLPETARATEAESKLLNDKARQQLNTVHDVETQFEDQRAAVNTLRGTVKTADQRNNDILRELGRLTSDGIHKSAQAAINRADKALLASQETNSTVNLVSSDVSSKLKPLLNRLSDEQDLTVIKEKLNEAQVNILKSKQQWLTMKERLNEQKKKFEMWNNTIASRLQELRDKVTQARHTANGIHLSITSRAGVGVGCVRSYKVGNLAPSTTSSVVISYAIESDAQDASLLYLASDSTKEFLAVEMVNRTIRFVWNAGGGVGVVTHPRPIETGILKEDKNWYRIQVDRTSNIAKLSVRHQVLPDGSPEADGNPVTSASESGFSILNVGPRDTVWVGGLPPHQPRPPQLLSTSTGLVGCLHQLVLDGRPLGLWNFVTETKHSCTACLEGAGQTKDEATFSFTGDGYSLHNSTSYIQDKLQFSLALRLRTLDENALIFLGTSPHKDQYISLMLRDGHVIFRIGYGENSFLELNTTSKFNTGKWFHCEAVRVFDGGLEQAQLKVYYEGETESSIEASPSRPPSEDEIPDIMEFVLGGTPPGFSFNSPSLKVPGSFLGCVKDIQVGTSGLNPLSGRFYGVEAVCSLSPQGVSFQGRGYLHLESHPLKKKKSSFEFVFRTLQPNAFLMLTMADDRHYYSASLRDGHVVVFVNTGENKTVLESTTRYTDGQMHAVSVTKQGRKMELRVDEKVEATATLSGGEYTVKVPGKAGGLYLGGVPLTMSVDQLVASTQPLLGAIRDVIFNNQLIKFDQPVAFVHAAIGRLGPDPLLDEVDSSPSLPAPPSECHKVSSYSLEPGAVKFGDSPESYIRMSLGRKNNLQNFVLQFGFRTHYPNGLLFIIPPSKRKQRPFLMASLHNKKLVVEARNKKDKNFKLEAPPVLNDGAWHHVSLHKEDHLLSVEVDSMPVGRIKVPKKLNVGNVLYMGGLPKSSPFLPGKLVQSLEAFKGCVRQLVVNNQMEDLVGPRKIHHNVGQCFPQVERGSYFSGDAYAIYESEFQISDLQEFELQFRTSELTGILLSVSEPSGSPALSLELNDGKVVMTCDTGDNKPLRVEHHFPTRYSVCNNEWHSIHASYVPSGLTLKVDNYPNQYGLSQNGGNAFARTSSPLFIGGLPDNATGGTLGTRDNFRGCIRNIVIGRKQKDWVDMATLENIHLNSCPITS